VLIDFNAPIYDESGYGEALAETAKNLGLTHLCISGGEARYGRAANSQVRHISRQYPELFIPFARMDLDRDGPETVERFARAGFQGLCTWAPRRPYDDESYFPSYEAAQALRLPVQFHTGFLPHTPLDRARGVRCENMRPVYLDTIARCFPELTIVGVGLGGPWLREALEAMRNHQRVFFDLSGDVLNWIESDPLAALLGANRSGVWEKAPSKGLWNQIIFGSGVRHEEIASVERDYQRMFRSLAVDRQQINDVLGATAARLLNVSGSS